MVKVAGHVFISYAREDSAEVGLLQRRLEAAGISVWRDRDRLWPGQDWRAIIRLAIADDALVFLACFSSRSMDRKKGYQYEELQLAVEQVRLRQPGEIWLIPVRLDDCQVPDLELGAGKMLSSLHWVNFFGPDRDAEVGRLVTTVNKVLGGETLVRPQAAATQKIPAYWATADEVRGRTEVLADRSEELTQLASFAASDADYMCLVGAAWSGKTSLLAESAMRLRADCDVVCYFLSRREGDADSSGFLAAVVPQLAWLLGDNAPAASLHEFRALWQRAAERASATGRHLLLIVDGLDEDIRPPGLPSVAALLPFRVPSRAHVLASSRPHPEPPADIPVGHPLGRIQPVCLSPFASSHELAALARQEVDDLLRQDDGLAASVLGLLAAAAGPLAVDDLAAMIAAFPHPPGLARRIRRLLTVSAGRSVQRAGLPGDDRFQFAHESLLAYAQADKDLAYPDFRDRIHQWAGQWRTAGWPSRERKGRNTPWYLLETYPSTLTREPELLAELASDVAWLDAAIHQTGVDHVLADLRRAEAANPGNPDVAAVLALVVSQAYNLRIPQLEDEPGYIMRQLCSQACESADSRLADDLRHHLRSCAHPFPIPLWTSRHPVRALTGELGRHDDEIFGVALMPDGRVVSCGFDAQVLIWDPAAPGVPPIELGYHDDTVWAVAVLPDGRVVTGGEDGQLLAWDPAAAPDTAPARLGRHQKIRTITVLPDGRLVTSGNDHRVLIWDPDKPGARSRRLGQHDDGVWAVAVLPDGRVLTGGKDGQVLISDPATRRALPLSLGCHWEKVTSAVALPDGRVVTSGTEDGLLMWDPASPGTEPTELGSDETGIWAMAVLPDGRLVTGGSDQRVLIWDPGNPDGQPSVLGSHDGTVLTIAVLPDGRVITGGADDRLLLWDPAQIEPDERGQQSISHVSILPDGLIATGGEDGRVLVWDPATKGRTPVEIGRTSHIWAMANLPDGRVVTGGGDGRVLLWDPRRPGAKPSGLGQHDRRVMRIAMLPDGRIVTGGDDGRVLVWDSDNPGSAIELARHDERVQSLRILRDGRVVSGGDDGKVLISDPRNPSVAVELGRHKAAVQAIAQLHDGLVITGGWDEQVLVWDPAAPGAAPVKLRGQRSGVSFVEPLPDGRVVGKEDKGYVLIWNPAVPGTSPARLGYHPRSALAVLTDGQVITGDEYGKMTIWDPRHIDNKTVIRVPNIGKLAVISSGQNESLLALMHFGGFSIWSTSTGVQVR